MSTFRNTDSGNTTNLRYPKDSCAPDPTAGALLLVSPFSFGNGGPEKIESMRIWEPLDQCPPDHGNFTPVDERNTDSNLPDLEAFRFRGSFLSSSKYFYCSHYLSNTLFNNVDAMKRYAFHSYLTSSLHSFPAEKLCFIQFRLDCKNGFQEITIGCVHNSR